jgi:hypothetical protein
MLTVCQRYCFEQRTRLRANGNLYFIYMLGVLNTITNTVVAAEGYREIAVDWSELIRLKSIEDWADFLVIYTQGLAILSIYPPYSRRRLKEIAGWFKASIRLLRSSFPQQP